MHFNGVPIPNEIVAMMVSYIRGRHNDLAHLALVYRHLAKVVPTILYKDVELLVRARGTDADRDKLRRSFQHHPRLCELAECASIIVHVPDLPPSLLQYLADLRRMIDDIRMLRNVKDLRLHRVRLRWRRNPVDYPVDTPIVPTGCNVDNQLDFIHDAKDVFRGDHGLNWEKVYLSGRSTPRKSWL